MSMLEVAKDVYAERAMNAQAAGTGDTLNGNIHDTKDKESIAFIAAFGAIVSGAVTTFKLQQGDAANGSDMADVTGASISVADTDDNKLQILELIQPQKRYVRSVVVRATQNATVDSIIAVLTGSKVRPVTQNSTYVANTTQVFSP